MTTFKATVQRHQERRDGKFPVSIRITQNRKIAYLPTGLYVEKRQINSKTFEIKDQFVLERTNKTIRDYEKILLTVSTQDLLSFNIEQIKSLFGHCTKSIDYFAFCDTLIAKNKMKYDSLRLALKIVKEEMNYEKMSATDFTAAFLRKFRERLDTRTIKSHKSNGEQMTNRAKQQYLTALCSSFKEMCSVYNTEFVQVIMHNPFVGLEQYKIKEKEIQSIEIDDLRKFFNVQLTANNQIVTRDVIKMMFCLCGMNSADIVELKKENYNPKTNRITYCREKTKNRRKDSAKTSVLVPEEIRGEFNRYYCKTGERLFDFGESFNNKDKIRNRLMRYSDILCKQKGLPHMNPYMFRHTWATIARNKCEVSKDDIDLCLVHRGINPMADVYIEPDYSRIDRANRKVLDYVFGGEKKGDA